MYSLCLLLINKKPQQIGKKIALDHGQIEPTFPLSKYILACTPPSFPFNCRSIRGHVSSVSSILPPHPYEYSHIWWEGGVGGVTYCKIPASYHPIERSMRTSVVVKPVCYEKSSYSFLRSLYAVLRAQSL